MTGTTINLSEFQAGEYEQQLEYRSFVPGEINQHWMIADPDIQVLLDGANRTLGELNAYSQLIPDV
ncbi:MAG: hypothetical protein Q9M82_04490, partial [Mariprofundus sp.]|nr:hypothetical protein [Mariprofundus sp.]